MTRQQWLGGFDRVWVKWNSLLFVEFYGPNVKCFPDCFSPLVFCVLLLPLLPLCLACATTGAAESMTGTALLPPSPSRSLSLPSPAVHLDLYVSWLAVRSSLFICSYLQEWLPIMSQLDHPSPLPPRPPAHAHATCTPHMENTRLEPLHSLDSDDDNYQLFFLFLFFLNPLRFNYPDSKNKQSCPSSSAAKFTVKPTFPTEGCVVAVKTRVKTLPHLLCWWELDCIIAATLQSTKRQLSNLDKVELTNTQRAHSSTGAGVLMLTRHYRLPVEA